MDFMLVAFIAIGLGAVYGYTAYRNKQASRSAALERTEATLASAPEPVPTPTPEPAAAPVVDPAPPEATPKAILDVNNDGKVNVADVKAAVKKTKARVKKAADANNDGKVNVADVKAAVKKTKAKSSKKS
jgi:hypothetical protein